MRIALDTNVLAYSEGSDDDRRQRIADGLLVALRGHEIILPVQVLIELHGYLTRKKKVSREAARDAVASWQALVAQQADTTVAVQQAALDLAAEHHLQIFDAIILAAAAEARCKLLLSEDMGEGFVWRGTTVANPFAATPHPLLADALRG